MAVPNYHKPHPLDDDRIRERRSEDFRFFLWAHAKGNPAMYDLLRDRSLDRDEAEDRLWEGA